MPQYDVHRYVEVNTSFIGFHRWPDAPDEVMYLRDLHRHEFRVQASIEVFENDREIEFHMLKRQVNDWIHGGGLGSPLVQGERNLGSWSCEQIAEYLLDGLRVHYPDRSYYEVSVSEDGENGATVSARRTA